MKMWIKKEKCTGCAACANVCPIKAITMQEDDYGFRYPQILDMCINCGACKRVCQLRGEASGANKKRPKIFAGWSLQKEVRLNSTSGGVFSELANCVLDKGGYIAGAQYGDNNIVEHVIVNTKKGLEKLRQSKYAQSSIGNIFIEVKKLLQDKKQVLFCGTPCQVAGLYSYLGGKCENLYTLDFICRGVNSPKAYRAWINDLETHYKRKVSKIWFKYKKYGWKKSPWCTRIEFENGKHIVQYKKKNLFMRGYLELNLYIRPSCGNCDFKGTPKEADITLGDFWGLDAFLDDDMGTTMIMVNSEKGEKLLCNACHGLKIYEREIEEIRCGNEYFYSSVQRNLAGDEFLERLQQQSFSKLVRKEIRNKYVKQLKDSFKKGKNDEQM